MGIEQEREFYEHDAGCPEENFTPTNERGMKTCLDCAGVFDAETGKGVSMTDTRFDENWDERRAAGAGWNDQRPE